MSMFETAARLKYRYPHPAAADGITTEQLFDLPLLSSGPCLNTVAQSIHAELQALSTTSFVETPTPDKTNAEDRLNIVKRVIAIKQEAAEEAKNKVLKAEKRKKIIAALAQKEDAALEGKTEKQLLKELAALD